MDQDPSKPGDQGPDAHDGAPAELQRLFADVRPARHTGNTPPPLPFQGVNDHGVVVTARACRSCGYDLRGLTMADACPECHWPVKRSVSEALLVNSPPEYLRLLRAGITLVIVAQFASLGAGVVAFAASMTTALGAMSGPGAQLIEVGVAMLVSASSLVGWWLFSTPDPALAADEQRTNSRRVLRGFATATLASYLLMFVLRVLYLENVIPSGTPIIIDVAGTPMTLGSWVEIAFGGLALVTMLMGLVVLSVAMAYLSGIAARIPNPGLQRETKRMVWLVWVLGLLPCGTSLVSFILLLIYLFRTRAALGNVLEYQRSLGGYAA